MIKTIQSGLHSGNPCINFQVRFHIMQRRTYLTYISVLINYLSFWLSSFPPSNFIHNVGLGGGPVSFQLTAALQSLAFLRRVRSWPVHLAPDIPQMLEPRGAYVTVRRKIIWLRHSPFKSSPGSRFEWPTDRPTATTTAMPPPIITSPPTEWGRAATLLFATLLPSHQSNQNRCTFQVWPQRRNATAPSRAQ